MKPTSKQRRAAVAGALLLTGGLAYANNIQVTNISVSGQNPSQDFALVGFDLSWDNSWRVNGGPANWDAAWVFVKFRRSGGSWTHARLNYVNGTSDGHIKPPGSEIRTTSDGAGVFIHRNAAGTGNVTYPGVRLRWNYGLNSIGDTDAVDVQVIAIEMVHVPTAAFRLGGGLGSEAGKFYSAPLGFSSYLVANENAITVSTATGNLYYSKPAGSTPGDQLGPIPAAYPKGFNGFYCMKYETSQDQWVTFFNSLTDTQKLNRDVTDSNHKNSDDETAGNAVSWTAGSASTPRPDFPLNYVSWDDALAYLDWAGLRPMTELEYEKACRGTLSRVSDELAWGNANAHENTYTLLSAGSAFERISDPGVGIGNAAIQPTTTGLGRPMRCGVFASSAVNKTREETGGSYYGIMELSGNLYERTISAGYPAGRAFTGSHGDGVLNAGGDANVAGWPLGTAASGGYRGGSYTNSSNFCRVSDRYDAATSSDLINSRIGFRGVRTAP